MSLNPPIYPPPRANSIVVTVAPLAVSNASGNSVSFTDVNRATPAVNAASSTGNSIMPTVNVGGAGLTTGANGEIRYALTDAFGYYQFDRVAGETYIFKVSAKRNRLSAFNLFSSLPQVFQTPCKIAFKFFSKSKV